jgi:ribosome maturation factor RimP
MEINARMRVNSEMETRLLQLLEPEAKAAGFEVVRLRLTGGRSPILQIMAERADGRMDVEDCARLSRRLSPILDAEDPIDGEYALEVSSPGIDRPLTRQGDFGRWAGHEARIELAIPAAGRKRFQGTIIGETDGIAEIRLKEGDTVRLALADMAKASLVLTDALIAEARSRGSAPDADEEIEENFDDVEVEDDDAPDGTTPDGEDERE